MAIILWNPIVAMLHNQKENRWHPIIYYESPLPGPAEERRLIRHKSKGHHTTGFAARDEAITAAKELAESIAKECSDTSKCPLAIDEDIEWTGEGVPANVAFFGEVDGKIKRML